MFPLNIPTIEGPIKSSLHCPGLFSGLVTAHFDFDSFRKSVKPGVFHSDNGSVWSRFIENIDRKLPREAVFLDELELPITLNIKYAIYLLASKIITEKANWNVGIFWSRGEMATLGNHFDDDEVYTIQLHGNKEWIVDHQDIEYLCSLVTRGIVKPISSPETFTSSETWIKAHKEIILAFKSPQSFLVAPGDLLITPSYTLHNVRSLSTNSVSINIGISRNGTFSKTELLYGT
jgi:hypothetical protein